MVIKKTKIKGAYIIEPKLIGDKRGYFYRVYAKEILDKFSIKFDAVHINRSFSEQKGTIRGLHYQKSPMQEDKIIQCLEGAIFDVVLDLRKNSKTYGQWIGEKLTAKNKKMLLIPKGCAHAFQTLEKNTGVEYFVSQYYSSIHERGIRWNDPIFKIDWPIKKTFLSEKDASWPLTTK